jgi:hypothetical protein
MTELNQHNVGFCPKRPGPQALVDECLCAPAASGEIDHLNRVLEIVLDVLPPPAAGMFRRIFTDSGVAYDCQTQHWLNSTSGRSATEQQEQQSELAR